MGNDRSKAVELEEARHKLESAMSASPAIKARLETLSYGDTALQAGYVLYKDAGGADIAVFRQSGEQQGATLDVNLLRSQVESQAGTFGRIANAAFADDIVALTALGRHEPKPPTPAPVEGEEPPADARPSQSQAAFLRRTHRLYEGALGDPAFLAVLSGVGYTEVRLRKELADVTALEAADIEQEREKGETAGSHTAEKTARAALKVWLKRYTAIVTAGLKDEPDWLRELTLKPIGRPRGK